MRRGRHWARARTRARSTHRHPASIRTHHPLLLHPYHGHPLLLWVLHLHVVVVVLLLLLHANRHSLLLLHNMLRRHRSPYLVLRKLGHTRWKLLIWKHSGTSGPHLRTSGDCCSLHVDHSLRSGMLLYVRRRRRLRLLLIPSSGTPLLLHCPLFLVAVFSDN